MTYCEYIKTLTGESRKLHKEYHDNHYGFPVDDDNKLFERLMFEINQAGLNWLLILKKQDNFRAAFDNFNIDKVALYEDNDLERLMNDSGIIRNRLKIKAAIDNARIINILRQQSGSFRQWLDTNAKKMTSAEEWTRLFKKTFRFTGSEITNEFLISTGYLPGAHDVNCQVYKKIEKMKHSHEKE
jgi:DNA-3-methyladenine glycosylase I